MTPPTTPSPPLRSPPWLLIFLGGFVLLSLIFAAVVFSNRKAEEAKVVVDYDQIMRLDQTKRMLRERIGGDITRAGQSYGFCRVSCDRFWPDGGAAQTWQFVAPEAVLVAWLYLDQNFEKTAPRYMLKFQWASSRDDGQLMPVAPKLQQLLDSLLDRFGYPSEFRYPTPKSYVTRGNSIYGISFDKYRPVLGHIYNHNGHEKLRGQWAGSIQRTGPFTEDGSWLHER